MPLSLIQTVAPATEPLTLTEAKAYLRIDNASDDMVITSLLTAAREEAEMFTGRSFAAVTYALRLDEFPADGIIQLPRPPLQSVTSIAYLDADNVSRTLATSVYAVSLYTDPGFIQLATDQVWPSTYDALGAITVTFVAGYTGITLPERARMAIRLMLNDWYEHREAQLDTRVFCNETVKRLLWGLRIVNMY